MRTVLVCGLLAGCTLYERNDSDDIGVPPPGATGPVGRSFFIDRSLSGAPTTCPDFFQVITPHDVDVEPANVLVDGSSARTSVIRPEAASQSSGDVPNVAFTIEESWSSAEGPALPEIRYEMWVAGDLVTGNAKTTFFFETPNGSELCDFQWTLDPL